MVVIIADTPEQVPALSYGMPAVDGQHRCVILKSHLSVTGLSYGGFLVLDVRSHIFFTETPDLLMGIFTSKHNVKM